jgi:hypothetical protein
VWLYFRFPLGLRVVEELLAARDIIVSHETVRQWARKFGPAVCQPDPSPPSAGWRASSASPNTSRSIPKSACGEFPRCVPARMRACARLDLTFWLSAAVIAD